MLVSRSRNSRFDGMIKGFWTWPKYRENMHLHETEWELNSLLNLICGGHILSGSYMGFSLVLYVIDIFEWERDNILVCG